MSKFKLTVHYPGREETLYFDNVDVLLTRQDGTPLVEPREKTKAFAEDCIDGGKAFRDIRHLRIVLGLKCNYSCAYCLQSNSRGMGSDEASPDDVDPFVESMKNWFGLNDGSDRNIGFWGGEPFVYWKTLKPLAEKLREKYPKASFSIVTNGSLIDREKADWLDAMNFSVSISHDGPGQEARGFDPFKNEEWKATILDLYESLSKKKKISFSAMMHRKNTSRRAVLDWFGDVLGRNDFLISEGMLINDGDAMSPSEDDLFSYRNSSYQEAIANDYEIVYRFPGLGMRLADCLRRIKGVSRHHGSNCSVESPHKLSVDLKGNALTCNNVSAGMKDRFGNPHRIGHVSDFQNIRSNAGKTLGARGVCMKCPVLPVCKRGCALLPQGGDFERCGNAYSDSVVIFAIAVLILTEGGILTRIDGKELPERNRDIFGLYRPDKPEKKFMPIVRGVLC
jgi:uncharacterized protein